MQTRLDDAKSHQKTIRTSGHVGQWGRVDQQRQSPRERQRDSWRESHRRVDPRLQAREDIRTMGLRATPARTATLVWLRQSDSPLTHAEVAECLEEAGFDKATTFRNLNDLTEAGLLRRTELGDRVWRFEAIDPNHEEGGHPHFLCVDCGSVTCLDDVQLTAGSKRESERVGQITEILLRGHCNGCR